MSGLGRPPLCSKLGCPLRAVWIITSPYGDDRSYRCNDHSRRDDDRVSVNAVTESPE